MPSLYVAGACSSGTGWPRVLTISCQEAAPRATLMLCRAPSLSPSVRIVRSASLSPCLHTSQQSSSRLVHIGHSSDVHRWRSPEKEEVRRQFRSGVKLGSEFVKIREQEAIEKQLIAEDKFTNWRMVYGFSLATALLLIGLNLVMVFVKPNPSPEYVPYVDPSTTASESVKGKPQSDRAVSGDIQSNKAALV